LITQLGRFFAPPIDGVGKLFLLHGDYGTGKSFISGMWWSMHGRSQFPSFAIRIDCSNITTNQVVREVARYFVGEELETVDAATADHLLGGPPKFVLFDQIRLDGDDEAARLRKGASPIDIVRAVSPLFAPDIGLCVLMAVQAPRTAIDRLHLQDYLPRGVAFEHAEVASLAQEEGAELLRRSGCERVSQEDRERLSARLRGIPLCLAAAARQVSELTAEAREAYLVHLDSLNPTESPVGPFFSQLLPRLETRKQDNDTHPEALLRLLALMPGATQMRFLERLVQEVAIKRLREFHIDERRIISPFIMMSKDRIDLHPMAREYFRRELAAIMLGRSDPFTDVGELACIHLSAAKLSYEIISDDPKRLSLAEVEAIEGSIFHLLRYRDLAAKSSPTIRRQKSRQEWENHIFSGRASAEEITHFCYRYIAALYLLDGEEKLPRLLGQFETKAKILCHFFKDRKIDAEIPFFSDKQAKRLLFEVALCFQHCGRLRLAHLATETCAQVVERNAAPSMARDLRVEALEDKQTRSAWIDEVEVLALHALIEIRLGHHLRGILAQLEPYLHIAESIYSHLDEPTATARGLHSPNFLGAVVRVLSRVGHLKMLRGEIEGSIDLFAKATAVEARRDFDGRPRKFLSGEAARRYARALIRGRAQDCERVELAHQIVEANITKYLEYITLRQRPQSDLIPFLTLRARLAAVRGDFQSAKTLIHDAMEHDYVRAGECTLVAQVDLEIERIEIRILSETTDDGDVERLKKLIRRLDAENNLLMASECRVLCAKLLHGTERREAARIAGEKLSDQGVNLWRAEIDQLRASV
jgi:hypothetical protein